MIPIFTLQRQNNVLKGELDEVFKEVQKRGIYILGEKVEEFEKEFAQYLGVKYAVGVASGTDAISLALLSVGVKEGDEVIMPANSYPTVFGVTGVGAIPKLVDIDSQTFNIDPEKIERAITIKTKAVIAVHLYGQPANLERILPIVRKNKLVLIEDAAQAHGAEINMNQESRIKNQEWKKVGTVGDIGCFSFYPTKNLGCFGDGGMVVTNNREIFKKIKLLRMYGEEKRYQSVMLGRNSRLDELQAAILLVKLKYLDKWNERRREIAKQYNTQYSILNTQMKLILPIEMENVRHVHHLYVIRSKKRDKLKKYLEIKGIQTAIHFPTPIHLQHSFEYLNYKEGDFPESERASREILSLPMFPELGNKEIEFIIKTIRDYDKKNNI